MRSKFSFVSVTEYAECLVLPEMEEKYIHD